MDGHKEVWVDHQGKEYTSRKEMCRDYGISEADFQARVVRGWSVEKALTTTKAQLKHPEYEFPNWKNEWIEKRFLRNY